VRASSWRRYEVLVRVHALPFIGKIPLARLGPEDLQRLYANRLAAGSAPASVHQLHSVIHRSLEDAVGWHHVGRNVASLATPPKIARTQRSCRQIVVTRMAVAALRRHRVRQNEERVRAGDLWVDLDLVFANEVGSRSVARWLRIPFKPRSRVAVFPISPFTARGTARRP
jgi:hypothetical protein